MFLKPILRDKLFVVYRASQVDCLHSEAVLVSLDQAVNLKHSLEFSSLNAVSTLANLSQDLSLLVLSDFRNGEDFPFHKFCHFVLSNLQLIM